MNVCIFVVYIRIHVVVVVVVVCYFNNQRGLHYSILFYPFLVSLLLCSIISTFSDRSLYHSIFKMSSTLHIKLTLCDSCFMTKFISNS